MSSVPTSPVPEGHPSAPATLVSRVDASGTEVAGARPAVAEPAILVRGLVKSYDGRAVVDGLDLEVPRGSIVALLGPNGAGKTTTVEILEGYRRADGGTVRVLGLDPAADGRTLRARLGLMLQDGGIPPLGRPRELLRLYASFFVDPRDPDELLATVGLESAADTRWRRLSGGQRQRLSLALALVGRPELALLDEPTAGMDPAAKAATRELIAGLRAAGCTILLTTHELHDVERLADRIVVIDKGRLVAAGTPRELMADAHPRLRLRLDRHLADPERADLADTLLPLADSGVPVVEADGHERYRIEGVEPTPSLVAAVAAWCAARGILPLDLRTTGATLEERYLELVGAVEDEEPEEPEDDRTVDLAEWIEGPTARDEAAATGGGEAFDHADDPVGGTPEASR